ncbi:TnsA endonuclease N-terminal domain-containing protein [Streptomyces sp. NBC_01571]|uniref:TnsA endonuclease N-terminal domain-containing protein n=1 Tax=Streptomyces sp. NBC_01571 TaxID=2975883 RepID=UPI002255E1EA|nr:TnsA endonuclease N-terminal domain-containing protein [Streptomyces sp. NBC_01571]MCX4573404.1 TnsA endonuclease N-terminal domain-containing protein [Streptomyces sp. NBC_01571]
MTSVFAQPFPLSTTVDGRRRRHIPDFLVLREKDVPLVVDVKPRHLLTRPKVNFALGWAREVVLSRGWDFQVWTEPPKRSWRACGSSRAIAASGCSRRTCSRRSGRRICTGRRWGMRSVPSSSTRQSG